jgi:hypothetical protein
MGFFDPFSVKFRFLPIWTLLPPATRL